MILCDSFFKKVRMGVVKFKSEWKVEDGEVNDKFMGILERILSCGSSGVYVG